MIYNFAEYLPIHYLMKRNGEYIPLIDRMARVCCAQQCLYYYAVYSCYCPVMCNSLVETTIAIITTMCLTEQMHIQ